MATVPYLHRYLNFYQSNNSLAFATTTSGTALIIDRASTKISLQSTWQDYIKLIDRSAKHIVIRSSTDSLWVDWDYPTSLGHLRPIGNR
jgi:hypothetical protein